MGFSNWSKTHILINHMKITPQLYHIQTNQDMRLFANKSHTQQHLRTQVQPNRFLNVKQDPDTDKIIWKSHRYFIIIQTMRIHDCVQIKLICCTSQVTTQVQHNGFLKLKQDSDTGKSYQNHVTALSYSDHQDTQLYLQVQQEWPGSKMNNKRSYLSI